MDDIFIEAGFALILLLAVGGIWYTNRKSTDPVTGEAGGGEALAASSGNRVAAPLLAAHTGELSDTAFSDHS